MFNPLKGLGDIKKMRDQAMAMQKQLAQEQVVVEQHGIRIVMRGDQKIIDVSIDGETQPQLISAINEAIKRTQEIAARKLTQMGGMFGGQ